MNSIRVPQRAKLFATALALVLTATLCTTLALAGGLRGAEDPGGQGNPTIFPPNAAPYGHTYAEWDSRWWQWAFAIPADASNPFFPGGNVLQNQSGTVWFLTGVGPSEVRSITIPTGIALYFPIVNAECSTVEPDPFHGGTVAELRACAKGWMDSSSGLSAEIDGQPVQNISAYRHQSTLNPFGPLGDNNILGVPGATGLSTDEGFYLMLAPLPVGAHTIHFAGLLGGSFAIETTYNIQVTGGGRSIASGVVAPGLAGTGVSPAGSSTPVGPTITWGQVKSIYR